MTRRRPGDATESETADDERPDDTGVDAAFDVAQRLLDAALDEVRTAGSNQEASPTTDDGGSGLRRSPRRRGRTSGDASSASAEASGPTIEDADDSGGAPASRPGGRRRRARRREKEFAELRAIEALEQDAARALRRSRGEDVVALQQGEERSVLPDPRPADEAPVLGSDRSGPLTSESGPSPRDVVRQPRRAMIVFAALAVVVGAALAVVAVSGDGTPDRAAPASGATTNGEVRLAFDAVTTPEGVMIRRVWRLQGTRGTRFLGRLSFSNPSSAPLNVVHTEVIPKSLAASVGDIGFDPEPTVIQADPVVQYSVDVPAGSVVIARYEIEAAPDGLAVSRLRAWADDAEVEAREGATTTAGPTSTTSLTMPAPPPPSGGTGAIVIRTIVHGVGGTFRYSGPGTAMVSGNVQDDAQSAPIPVAAGLHAWTQVSGPPGSSLVGVACNDSDSTVSGATATFAVQAGETVVCSWTNQ